MVDKKKRIRSSKDVAEGIRKEKESGFRDSSGFIRQRERLASRLGGSPRAQKEATAIIEQERQQQQITEEEIRKIEVEREQRGREEVGKEFLEEKEFFKEELPKRTELDIPQREGVSGVIQEVVPILGSSIGAVQSTLTDLARKGQLAFFKTDEAIEPLIQNPETARELALRVIQEDTIKTGLTADEKFGTIIEAIPGVGKAATSFADLLTTPGGNVKTILGQLDSERERASVLAEKAMTGKLEDPFRAFGQLENMEANVIGLETRIQILSRSSATLRANPDEVNRIEERILRTKERIFIAKQAAAAGIVAPATDSNIFLTLQEIKNR